MTVYGADVGQLRKLAQEFQAKAAVLESDIAGPLAQELRHTVHWIGQDADTFKHLWFSSLSPTILRVSQQLNDASSRLTNNANDQERASGADGTLPIDVVPDGRSMMEDMLRILREAFVDQRAKLTKIVGGMSTEEIAQWWSTLSEPEKAHYIKTAPDIVGNLNGVDATSRDLANRAVLEDEIADAQAEVDAFGGKPPFYEFDKRREYDFAERSLNELKRVHEAVYHGPPGETRQLLTLDFRGARLKAAVSLGDVDRASHVTVFVPGMTTNVHDSLAHNVNDMRVLRNEIKVQGGLKDSQVAAVAWLGYDAPRDLSEAVSPTSAILGSSKLSSFLSGVDASRECSVAGDPLLTVVGHSYGSTTAGHAAQAVPEGVIDRFVLAGSPGSATDSLSKYRVPSGKVYVSTVDGDPVALAGATGVHGTDPRKLDGINVLSGDISGADNGFIVDATELHTSYLKKNTQSLADIARVAAGKK